MAENNKPVDITNQGAIESTLTLFPGWLREMSKGTTGPQKFGGNQYPMSMQFTKYLGKEIELKITGPFKKTFTFDAELPPNDGDELQFKIDWGNGEIKLFLFAQLVATQKAEQGQ
jgi:hypothetical protein